MVIPDALQHTREGAQFMIWPPSRSGAGMLVRDRFRM